MPIFVRLFDESETLQKVIPFIVTVPLFSWIGVQVILFKQLYLCMTPDDQKSSKKFICASELARVFKSLICLFLTTSFLVLDLDNKTEDQIESEKVLETAEYGEVSQSDEYVVEALLEMEHRENAMDDNSASEDTYDAMGTSNYPF